MRRRAPLIAAVAVAFAILWGAADSLRPFATYDRDVVDSTPGLGALDSRYTVTLRRDQEACIRPVTLTPHSEIARFRVLAPAKRPAPPLEITASGPGYRSSATVSGYPTGSDQLPRAELDPPGRTVTGEVCARNAGRTPMELVGAQDIRSQVPAALLVDGEDVAGKDIELTLLQGEPKSIAERPGDLVARARDLTAGFAPEWLLWIVLVLVALGIPAAAIGGYVVAVSADRDDLDP